MLKITAEEVNFLVHQYLEETGYKHTAFTFRHESGIDKSALNSDHTIPPSMLLMYLEKALLMLQMETHLDKDEEVIPCNHPFTLLTPHICGYSKPTMEKSQMIRAPNIPLVQNPVFQPAYMLPQAELPLPSKTSSNIAPAVQSLMQPATHQSKPLPDPQSMVDVPVTTRPEEKQPIIKTPSQSSVIMSKAKVAVTEEDKYEHVTTSSVKPSEAILQSAPNTRGVTVLEGHQGMVYNVLWHPSKRVLASGGEDSSVRLWQVGNERKEGDSAAASLKPGSGTSLLQILPHVSNDPRMPRVDVTSLNWNNKRNMLVTGASDGIARVWSETGRLLFVNLIGEVVTQLKGGDGMILAAKWNTSGTKILTVGYEGGKLSVL